VLPEGGPTAEAFLRNAFLRVPAAIAAIGLDGRVLACNPAYSEIVGLGIDELVGSDALASVHPDDVDRAVAASVGRMEAGHSAETRTDPIRMLSRDGTTVWVQYDSLIIDEGSDEPYVLATMTDISVQVQSEADRARSEAWFRALATHQSDIITVVGFDSIVRYISPNCERVLGFSSEELIGTSGLDNIHPDDIPVLVDGLGAQMSEGLDARPFEYRQRCRDGSWLWLEATGRELPKEFGADAVIVNARDISERRRADAEAREAERRFRTAFAASPLGIAFADLDGRCAWVNDALAEIVGVPRDQLVGMWFQDFSGGEELARELHETARLLRGEIDSFRFEKRYEHPDGRTVWGRLHVSLVRDSTGAPTQLLGQIEDVTERKQLELSLTHDAVHDPLTGLLNRAGLRGQVDLAWEGRRAEAPIAVLFGDLDGFKRVNDQLGHDAGDEVLVHVAQRLNAAVRAGDVVARWGGDEFVILCPSVDDVHHVTRIADRIRRSLEAPFRLGSGVAEIAISIGVALDTGQPLPDLLIKDADTAAYRAKAAGRNRVVVATSASL
jgi:diguanylate cyclase (GGDEF)-like protein/PAS domain S-box-containing protein